jgi:hypothetical protein
MNWFICAYLLIQSWNHNALHFFNFRHDGNKLLAVKLTSLTIINGVSIAVLKRGEVCPMPYALCPMPYALCPMHVGYLMLLRKAIIIEEPKVIRRK